MLTPEQLLAFLPAAILLTLSPGPDNMMVLGIGMAKGGCAAWPSASAARSAA